MMNTAGNGRQFSVFARVTVLSRPDNIFLRRQACIVGLTRLTKTDANKFALPTYHAYGR